MESISEAIRDGRIRAFFQPVVRSLTGKVFSLEALARWFRPDGSMLSPAEFIPSLEQSGLITELDMEILRQACALYTELRERGTPVNTISVNLSRVDFRQPDLFERVTAMLDEYGLPHGAIKLEITESMMLDDADAFEKIFRRFADAGFFIWLDDFGSGYSSLNVLQSYDFDVIKFDMTFLKNMTARGRELLTALISMAKTLEIHTLTEGVETEEQREFLIDAGCEAQQGFLYARPIAREDLIRKIDGNPGMMEDPGEKEYWNETGRLNFLTPNPLKEYMERKKAVPGEDDRIKSHDGSLALVECSPDSFRYIFATEGYRERVRELGFDTVDGVSQALVGQRSHQFEIIRETVLQAIRKGTIEMVEYAYRDVYYRLSILCLTRYGERAMLAIRLNTFDSEREVETEQELLKHANALLSTYDLVVMFYMDSRTVKRIHTSNKMPIYDREANIEESLRKFVAAEVDPVDQMRYLKFLNFETLEERVAASPESVIQGLFRMRWDENGNNWYVARLAWVPTPSERVYMLTVQHIQSNIRNWLERMVVARPELLE